MTKTPGSMPYDFRTMWPSIIKTQEDRFQIFRRPRPLTIMGNYRTLNNLITGQDQSAYLMFDKLILHTSYGDIHFLPHKGHEDGELTFL